LIGCSGLRRFSLAACDRGSAKRFDGIVKWVAGLFAKDFAEEHAQRADISTQRRFLKFAGRGLKLGKTLGPVSWSPQRRHTVIMPCS
jgi:hypothetical protein